MARLGWVRPRPVNQSERTTATARARTGFGDVGETQWRVGGGDGCSRKGTDGTRQGVSGGNMPEREQLRRAGAQKRRLWRLDGREGQQAAACDGLGGSNEVTAGDLKRRGLGG